MLYPSNSPMTTALHPTSQAQLHLIPEVEIKIDLDRFRQDPGDLKGLAESIKLKGLIQPIVVDASNNLIAGFRRLGAMRLLEWSHIPCVRLEELDELERREIELEENIKRKAFDVLEEQKAILEIHRLKKARDPNWSSHMTAAIVGQPKRERALLSEAKLLVEASEMFPEIKTAKTKTQMLSWARSAAMKLGRTIAVKEAVKQGDGVVVSVADRIIHGDSVEVIKTIPDATFDAIITDPPFGIDYDELKVGSESQVTSYEDTEEMYERLLSMAPDLYRVLKPNGWLIWFFGMSWYEGVKTAFRSAGFTVDELPIVWDRREGRCYTMRPDRYFARSYDVALHCIKGDPEMIQRGKPNIISVAPVAVDDRHATVERPVGLYSEIIQRLTVRGEYVADFFVGSGACLVAAAQLGRQFFGVEKDQDRHALAVSRVAAHLEQRNG
jgi:site-specific DNA-methyltransferase (adenine-specific)